MAHRNVNINIGANTELVSVDTDSGEAVIKLTGLNGNGSFASASGKNQICASTMGNRQIPYFTRVKLGINAFFKPTVA